MATNDEISAAASDALKSVLEGGTEEFEVEGRKRKFLDIEKLKSIRDGAEADADLDNGEAWAEIEFS